MALNSTSLVYRYPDLHLDQVGYYLLVYNPIAPTGVSVLNQAARYIFELIEEEIAIKDILTQAQTEDEDFTLDQLKKILSNLAASNLIYFNQAQRKEFKPLKLTHLSVWLHITNQCNLRCTYCYVQKTPDKMSAETGEKAIRNIVRDAKKHDFNKITFKFSGGECLLEFPLVLKLKKLAEKLAQKAKIKTDFVAMTNGVLISPQVAKTLKEEGFRAAVSLDGLEEYHDQQRVFPSGKGSFKQVERGIKNLQKAQVPFNVSVTITKHNVDNIPDLTNYLLENKIPFAFNFYRENPNAGEGLTGEDEKLITALKRAYQIIGENPPRYSLVNGLLDRVVFRKPHRFVCGKGQSYLVIRDDGKLVSCQMSLEDEIGSIDDEDLIISMRRGNQIIPRNLSVEQKKPCHQCKWKYICAGGCPLSTYRLKGSDDVNSPDCKIYKALIPEALKVEAKRLIKYGLEKS